MSLTAKEMIAVLSNSTKDCAKRFNEGKPQVSYMLEYPTVFEAMARIMEFGGRKYQFDNQRNTNWKKGGKPDHEYLDSCLRHILKFNDGEEFDLESGCSHLGHAIWNLMTLLEINHNGHAIDRQRFDAAMKKLLEEREVCDPLKR